MTATLYLEGGGDSKELHARCREGFRKLLQQCGFSGRMPKLVACGGREATFDDFKTAHALHLSGEYVALWVDSEDPVTDVEKPWEHLANRDGWQQPKGSVDRQVLLMTTCMETWIVSDRPTLRQHYGTRLQESALPLSELESRPRQAIQDALHHATRHCSNAYAKGKRSFEVLGKLDPEVLQEHLPSFRRVRRVLNEML